MHRKENRQKTLAVFCQFLDYLFLMTQHGVGIFAPAVLGHILSLISVSSGAVPFAPVEIVAFHQFRDNADSAPLLAENFAAAGTFQNVCQVLPQAAEIGFVAVVILKKDGHNFTVGTQGTFSVHNVSS